MRLEATSRRGRLLSALVTLLVVSAGCTPSAQQKAPPSGGARRPSSSVSTAVSVASTGGTLRLLHACCELLPNELDPSTPPTQEASELLSRCLVRSLYGYSGRPADEGGEEVQPDLAESLPDVSTDGLTWTIRMRRGLHFAPPFAVTLITSGDVERGIMRTLRSPAPDPKRLSQVRQWRARVAKLTVIAGAREYASGDSDTIAGIERPDDLTVRIRLVAQAGDLAARLAGSDTAPIPPGAAAAHERDYARFLVSSGPYMVEGSEQLDSRQDAAALSGFRPGTVEARDVGKPLPLGLILIRNPSWRRADDQLRPAYPDRIEVRTMHSAEEGARLVDSGAADLFSSEGPAPQIPISQVQRYRASAELQPRLHISRLDFMSMLVLNVAVPPLDDVHVRRAVAWAIDRQRLLDLAGGPLVGDVAEHLVPPGMIGGLLERYQPFPSAEHHGDLSAARREMALSRYDHNHDGRCDDRVCSFMATVAFSDDYVPRHAATVAANLSGLGLTLRIRTYSRASKQLFAKIGDPRAKIAMAVSVGFDKGSAFSDVAGMMRMFTTPVPTTNQAYSLVGASPQQLRDWGYTVLEVPTIDPELRACEALRGVPQTDCWARLDARLTEALAVAVPLLFQNDVRVTSARVGRYTFDQYGGLPAFDAIELVPGSG